MKHATTIRDGYTVPLIGIAEEETQEKCSKCGKSVDLLQVQFVYEQPSCGDCANRLKE